MDTTTVDVLICRRPKLLIPEDMVIQYGDWWQECHQSLSIPNVNVIQVYDEVPCPPLDIRMKSYTFGDSEFVSHVNDDDIVLGDPFSQCVKILQDNPSLVGVYTNSYIDYQNRRMPFHKHKAWTRQFNISVSRPIHELCVMRRNIVEKSIVKVKQLLESSDDSVRINVAEGEQLLYSAAASFGDWLFLPDTFGYVWRKHQHGVHHQTFDARLPKTQRTAIRTQLMQP